MIEFRIKYNTMKFSAIPRAYRSQWICCEAVGFRFLWFVVELEWSK